MTPAEPRTVSLADDGPPNHDDRENVASEAGGTEEVDREKARSEEVGGEEGGCEEGACEEGAGTALA